MFNVQALSELLELTPRQVYTRLETLKPLLGKHLQIGRNNQKLLDDQGLAILRRFLELERQGMAAQAAVKLMEIELTNSESNRPETNVKPDITEILIVELKAAIARLERENEWLRRQLEEAQAQLRAMLPGPKSSLWRRLTALFKG